MSACFTCNEPLHNCICPPGSQSPKGLCAPSPTIVEMSPEEIQAAFGKADELFKGKKFEDGAVISDKERPSDKGATVELNQVLIDIAEAALKYRRWSVVVERRADARTLDNLLAEYNRLKEK